jgi:hypothetical protein
MIKEVSVEAQDRLSQDMENIVVGQRKSLVKLTEIGKHISVGSFFASVDMLYIEEIALLRGLRSAPLANGDNHERCMEGTRSSILQEAHSWLENPNAPQIFWLTDVAGSGKSTVANHLAREWKSQGKLAGQFFFSRDTEQTRSTVYFFSTIAQQGLFHLGRPVRTAISDRVRELCDPVSANIEDQCTKIFVHPLKVISSTVVLVLDALDECEPTMLTRMLRILLSESTNLPHLRIFLSSRPDSHITESLQSYTVHRTSFRASVETNHADIRQFMIKKLKTISIPMDMIDRLISRSNGLFIWASTVCKLLMKFRGDRDQFLANLLVNGPHQMDSIYQIALKQALPDSEDTENIEAYKKVLSVIAVSFEPLSPSTIDKILHITNTLTIVEDLQSVLVCRNSDDPIRILHPTFREFLLRPFQNNTCHVDEQASHISMACACFDIMTQELCWDVCNLLERPIASNGDQELYQKRFFDYTTHALRYGCRFWSEHLFFQDMTHVHQDIYPRITRFFNENLLDWIYVICLIRSVKEPWFLLRKLRIAQTVCI